MTTSILYLMLSFHIIMFHIFSYYSDLFHRCKRNKFDCRQNMYELLYRMILQEKRLSMVRAHTKPLGTLSRYKRIHQNPHSGSIRHPWTAYAGCLVQTSLLVTDIKIRDILAFSLVTSQSTFNPSHWLCVPPSRGCGPDLSIRLNSCLSLCTE
jgi:hypothetical protein